MPTYKQLFIVAILTSVTNFLIIPIFPMQSSTSAPRAQRLVDIEEIREATDAAANDAREAVLNVNVANTRALDAIRTSAEVNARVREASQMIDTMRQRIELMQPTAALIDNARAAISEHARIEANAITALLENTNIPIEDRIRVAREAAQAGVNEGARNLREILGDSALMMKIGSAIVVIALCIYTLKYGIPAYINYLTKPYLISETSRSGWFGWFKSRQVYNLDDLIFPPLLNDQLQDLLVRVQTAKKYDTPLPNVLFYGPPGTGKTAFAKALAYASGLDYALTSGSEFTKITDLAHATNELRKLLDWAKKSKKGLLLFIDEAESLFANRKLPTTSKKTQDFINTFLALVADQSQKNIMFVLATNHPFKLDDAITNRIGVSIEFTLPQAAEREKILYMYLVKFAQENKELIVSLHPEIEQSLPIYADHLDDFSPRAIKFLAEEMIIKARRQESKELTNEIAQTVINQEIHKQDQTIIWEYERDNWTKSLTNCSINK